MDEDLYKSEICIDDSKDALDNTNEDILSHIQEFYEKDGNHSTPMLY